MSWTRRPWKVLGGTGPPMLLCGLAGSVTGFALERGAAAAGGPMLTAHYGTWVLAVLCALAVWRARRLERTALAAGEGRPETTSDAPRPDEDVPPARGIVRLGAFLLLGLAATQVYGRVVGLALPPLPAPGPFLLLVGGCLTTLAAAVLLVHGPPPVRPTPGSGASWRTIVAVTGVLALLIGLGTGAAVDRIARVEYERAAERAEPVEVPATVDERAWNWSAPERTEINEVLSTPTGPVIALNDGVIALDPRTGDERWRYRRPVDPAVSSEEGYLYGDLETTVRSEPLGDGKAVRLDVRTEGLTEEQSHELVLDSATGQVLASAHGGAEAADTNDGKDLASALGSVSETADGALVRETDDDTLLAYISSRGRDHDWEYAGEDSCFPAAGGRVRLSPDQSLTAADTVLVSLTCGEGLAEPVPNNVAPHGLLVALDRDTGDEVWRHEHDSVHKPEPGDVTAEAEYLTTAEDGSAVALAAGTLVLDAATGDVLYEGTERFWEADDTDTSSGELVDYSADSHRTLRCAENAEGDDQCTANYTDTAWDGEKLRATADATVAWRPQPFQQAELDESVVHVATPRLENGWLGDREAQVLPWGETESTTIGLGELGQRDAEQHDIMVEPAPGAVVVYAPEAPARVAGLV